MEDHAAPWALADQLHMIVSQIEFKLMNHYLFFLNNSLLGYTVVSFS
jgi:hypothetical protein